MALHEDVTCPLCGLGCDDLAIEADGATTSPVRTACALADGFFRRGAPAVGPRVAGKAATLDEAMDAAAERLGRSRSALIGGLAADVDGIRAALSLAERIGATVDHGGSAALFRNLAVLQRTGWSVTTFAELRNRCDLLVVVGPDPTPRHPRFFERWVAPPLALLPEGARRRVVFLGGAPSAEARQQLAGVDVSEVPLAGGDLPDAIAAIRAALRGHGAEGPAAALATELREARYGVIAWSAGQLDTLGADLAIEAVMRLVREVDLITRCSGLPLGGMANAMGANQVCVWRTGFPLRTSFAGGTLRHDAGALSWEHHIAECDAALWISALGAGPPDQNPDGPLILLCGTGEEPPTEPDVLIPVGTPGIDHPGHVFRGDAVVALRVGALVSRGLPSVETVLQGIEARIASVPAAGGAAS
ncbi:formylmethanofuran dehydrogenase [Arenibaculum pallidiluteum]|uniref:formylmethanofuran dehydrogenase n=1 Tax=Arenibaculum pallidiluteum TaxID=2812559 RepID=UPI001A959E46|nr:formylmethanofuran dehydrogenase [Arenibaculum pallidiluteum]